MIPQFDEKGKIFTDVISKRPVKVTIQTIHHRITGDVYIKPGQRLKDGLNKSEPMIAVTDAHIFDQDNQEIYQSNFLLVNQSNIIWLFPDEEENDI